MDDKIKELEQQINAFQFPLTYSQVLKREELIKELRRLKFEKMKGECNESEN